MQEPTAATPSDAPPCVARDETGLFLVVCKDSPIGSDRRVEHLEGHLAHVEANWRLYVVAGPMRRPGETAFCGSCFLVRAKDAEEACSVMRGDPYITPGLFVDIELTEITPSIGLWVGGKVWADAAAIAHRAKGG
ncbi:MAG: YciI family protein [Phenylobacterium sp.]